MSKRRRFVVSPSRGLLFWPALRRVVRAAGYVPVRFLPVVPDIFGAPLAVWGRLPTSRKWIARVGPHRDILTFEDSFLRSVLPGTGTPPIGITIDDLGVHFDAFAPSRLEILLKTAPLPDAGQTGRAARGRAFLRHYGLSKYNPVPRGFDPPPSEGYVLVLDQVAGDASIAGSGADAARFDEMLQVAIGENPGKRIVLRTHPATGNGRRTGHFGTDVPENVHVLSTPCNPIDLLEGAEKVYCVSSQMGFEAILAGHTPVVFAMPFYAGWGLSDDRHMHPQTLARRGRALTADQMFAIVMFTYSFWYDRTTHSACTFEQAAQQLLAESRHHWDGLRPAVMSGMQMWKRGIVGAYMDGAGHAPVFCSDPEKSLQKAKEHDGQLVVWAGRAPRGVDTACDLAEIPLVRMEDGFLRSSGLGAELVPAASLVLDDLGIYYDPRQPSRLETLIAASADLPDFARLRAAALRAQILKTGVSKYNLAGEGALPEFPADKQVILIPGQVEDDASIKTGAGAVCTNAGLIRAVRADNPDAFLVYKPHPDVLAGLRKGAVPDAIVAQYCDMQATQGIDALLRACDGVATMTSLSGFEGLLRGKPVTCYGMPFYAGWGLTTDRGPQCARRRHGVTLEGLVHATLIDYPRYIDPVSMLPCRPELIVQRLSEGQVKRPPFLRILSKLQGLFAGYAFIWRRGSRRS